MTIKPCPFCGGEATTSEKTTDKTNSFEFGWIGCQKCRCFINYINDDRGKRLATEAWNRRAIDEKTTSLGGGGVDETVRI